MITLQAARFDLAQALRDTGLNVIDHEPDRPAPPQVVIRPAADHWLTPNDTFATCMNLHLSVLLVTRPADAATATTALETMIQQTLGALSDSEEYTIDSISRPLTLVVGQQMAFPAVDITLTTQIPL